jgi:hypothetical protein
MDDLARAQSSLGRAIGRAKAGEDRELAQKVREGGDQLAQMLSGLLRLTRTHSAENRAFDAPVVELGRALASLIELLGTVHLVTVEDQIYLNDIRVKAEGKAGGKDLGAELRRHNVGGLSFHVPLEGPAIRALVAALGAAPADQAPRHAVNARLEQAGIGSVELAPIFRFSTVKTDGQAVQRDAGSVLAHLLELVTETWDHVAAGRVLNPLPLRRTIIETLEAGIESPPFWLAFPDCAPHSQHAVEVAMTALLLGKAAGLPAGLQQDLGIAALVHDAGYLSPGVGEGASALARHPVESARVVLRQRGFSEGKVRRLRAVLEHHRDLADPQQPPSLLGAILRLAEDYANLIRLYGTKVGRAEALGAMVKAGGRLYHPVLAQLLVNALGRYPPGTLLELADGRYGRVAAPARRPELWDKPLVRLLDQRSQLPTGPLIDLAEGPGPRRAVPG